MHLSLLWCDRDCINCRVGNVNRSVVITNAAPCRLPCGFLCFVIDRVWR